VPKVPEVEAYAWDNFLEKFRGIWKPGEHVGIIAPTGAGKTTLAGGLIHHCRNFALALDPKGGDSTLRGLGWPRLNEWPPPQSVYDDMAEGRPARYLVGPVVRSISGLASQVAVFSRALDGVYEDGGWTVYVDELQVLADRRFGGLGSQVERLLISARDRGVSVVSSYQRPANVPRTAADQASWLCVSYTRDRDVVDRVAEMVGRPKPEIRGALNGLDPYAWLIVGNNPRLPMMVTRPREIKRQTADTAT
jgi:DNA helicase HerA-like ATPase